MQTMHKVCLTLTGVCVAILCIGIGIGIGHRANCKSDSNDTSIEYEAYDDDYANDNIRNGGVINVITIDQEEEIREMAL